MTNKQIKTLEKVINYINNSRAYRDYTLSDVFTDELLDGSYIIQLSYDSDISSILDTCFSFNIGGRGGLFFYNDNSNREYIKYWDVTSKCRIY